jgi:hypothetical protein
LVGDGATVTEPAAWLPQVKGTLSSSDEIKDWLVGQFRDRPKSLREGLLCLTKTQLVFYRKRLFGAEVLVWTLSDVSAADVGVFGGISGPSGGIEELRVDMLGGEGLAMSFITRGDPGHFAALLLQLRSER